MAVLRTFCNNFMVKSLTQKQSDRSNLSPSPNIYKVVLGKWSPYIFISEPKPLEWDNLCHYRAKENSQCWKKKVRRKECDCVVLTGHIVFQFLEFFIFLWIIQLKCRWPDLSDFEIRFSRKIPIGWIIKLCYLWPHSFSYRWIFGTKILSCTRRRKVIEQGLLFIHSPALVIRHLCKYRLGSGLFQMAKHCTSLSSRSGPRGYTCEGKASFSCTELGN